MRPFLRFEHRGYPHVFAIEHAARVCCVQVETVRRWIRARRVPWRQAQRLDDAQRRLPAPWQAWFIDTDGRLSDGSVSITPGEARAVHYWRQLRATSRGA